MLILTPAKIEQTANVTASAVLALSVVVASALPAAPKPLRALNMPGMQKQMRPRIMVWVSGSGYLSPHHSLMGVNLMSPCPSTQECHTACDAMYLLRNETHVEKI